MAASAEVDPIAIKGDAEVEVVGVSQEDFNPLS